MKDSIYYFLVISVCLNIMFLTFLVMLVRMIKDVFKGWEETLTNWEKERIIK